MSDWFAFPARLALLSLLTASLTGPVYAASLPTATVFFSDSRTLGPSVDDADTLRHLKPLACRAAPPGVFPRTLPDAVARLRVYLHARETPAALNALAARSELKSEVRAQALAAAALASGKPTAALVALLAAHDRAPGDPSPLVNAAGVLNELSLYRESLTLLDAADKLNRSGGQVVGFSAQAISLNNRGDALSGLGLHVQAEKALRQAVQLDPLLSEAKTNLARTLSCEGKDSEAARFLRLGRRRSAPGSQTQRDIGTGETGDPGDTDQGSARRPAAASFDLSAGEEGTLPDIDVPRNPEEAVANIEVYQAALKAYNERIKERNEKRIALQGRLQTRLLNPATQQRTDDLTEAIATVSNEPGLRELQARIDQSSQDVADIWGAFFTGEGAAARLTQLSDEASRSNAYPEAMRALCVPEMGAMHDRWRTAMEGLVVDVRRYYKDASRTESGLIANLSDPDAHALATLELVAQADTLYSSEIVSAIASLARQEQIEQDKCLQQGRSPTAPTRVGTPTVESPARCPAVLKGVKLSFGFSDLLQANVNCESIEAKVSSGPIGVFGQFKVNGPAFSKATVMIGIQAGANLPGTKIGGGVSEGVFLEFGPHGLQDGGLKIDAKGVLGLKGGVYTVSGETKGGVTFAVVSGFSYY